MAVGCTDWFDIMRETSGLANYAKENRINWSAPRRCTVGRRHLYVNGICACGKLSRREENKIRNMAQAEIEAYKRELMSNDKLTDRPVTGRGAERKHGN